MTSSNGILTVITIGTWIVCILLGMGIGSIVGRFVGTILGWMVATTIDENIASGGRLGKRMGQLLDLLGGVGLGIFAALHAIVFITQNLGH